MLNIPAFALVPMFFGFAVIEYLLLEIFAHRREVRRLRDEQTQLLSWTPVDQLEFEHYADWESK